jgi:chaperonin GroES
MILIELATAPDKTKGGIILPDEAKRKPDEGIIKRIGEEVKTVAVGDHVLFGKYVGITLKLKENEDKEYILLHETDILGRYF